MKTSYCDTFPSDFIVIDTEGRPHLSELAIISCQGEVICDLRVAESPQSAHPHLYIRSLADVLQQFEQHSRNKVVICHNAQHDRGILYESFRLAHLPWHEPTWACSYQLAKEKLALNSDFSLGSLCQNLDLKVNGKYFNDRLAHSARYDAEFTYQLYRYLRRQQLRYTLKGKPNPFSSNRVDTPFQSHPNLNCVSEIEFSRLKAVVEDVERDQNHQSQGVVIQGEPGSGKTHIIMRLAKDLLKKHRLLFIRQPNHEQTVLFHTYSRILESLAEPVLESELTQLDLLLTRSLAPIIRTTIQGEGTQSDRVILQALESDKLELLGTEGTAKQRDYWDRIEKHALQWWHATYSTGGYSPTILKGILRYCRYTNPQHKISVARWLAASDLAISDLSAIGLNSWPEDMSREEFSLEAMSVIGKLSLLDSPSIVVFDQLESLGMEENRPILLAFGESIKEIFTHVPNCVIILNLFPDRWTQLQNVFDGSIVDRISQTQITLQTPDSAVLRDLLTLRLKSVYTSLEDVFDDEDLSDILNQSSIRKVLNRAADYYRHRIFDVSLPFVYEPILDSINAQPISSSDLLRRVCDLEKQMLAFQGIIHDLTRSDKSTLMAISPADPNTSVNFIHQEKMIKNYLVEQKLVLENQYGRFAICDDNDDIGKLRTITGAMSEVISFSTSILKMGQRRLPEHIVIHSNQEWVVGFLHVENGNSFLARLRNFNQLLSSYPRMQFKVLRDARQRVMSSQLTQTELARLNQSGRGSFQVLWKNERVELELLYKLVMDIQNRDLEVDLSVAMKIVRSRPQRSWITQLFA